MNLGAEVVSDCGALFAQPQWQDAWSATAIETCVAETTLPVGNGAAVADGQRLRLISASPFWTGYEADGDAPAIWSGNIAYLGTLYASASPLNTLTIEQFTHVIAAALEQTHTWEAQALVIPGLERPDLVQVARAAQNAILMRLDLISRLAVPATIEDYLAGLSKSGRSGMRREHRRAQEAGVTLHRYRHDDPDLEAKMHRFTDLTTQSATRHGIPPLYDAASLLTMARTTMATLITAESAEQILAGTLAFTHDNVMVLWAAGVEQQGMEEHHAYTFLLHEIIDSICGSPITVLDFGRGNVTFKQRRGFTSTDQWTPVLLTADDPKVETELVKMDATIAQMLGQPA
ncbi:GNAT family N-acetyltransferase [Luteipulveratus flavus]|uniref:GNAT family N-acetyltransferase n=1 Tax=Luteipulveratus flavus TaxID=3031728 RepID=A0ABT6C4J5_9MICO|nr:GNAT family N-acetyltransferase [Luteipulveratus sp. YIM 133296]MDF8263217.1 GNAT family N-acetyltransferase [Luteipulveratus sp. YIM 133296]